MKHTKIVATIGPASEKQETIEAMIRAGMNVARLNFSHGTYQNHALLVKHIRAAAKKIGVHVGILADLQGPRIRLGELPAEGIEVLANSHVTFSTAAKLPKGAIPVTYRNMHKDLKAGDRMLIADGIIEVIVERVKGQDITTRVLLGGLLKSHKGINVPTATLHIPPITDKDKRDVAFALSQGVDMVALSFVMSPENVHSLRATIRAVAKKLRKPMIATTPIIVKIEKHEAVKRFDEILEQADGVMVARGDLALEIDQAEVPMLQKTFIEKCRHIAKSVIVATEMLASMADHPRPTRAEISDVGHAVMDHTDATMLSGETASGSFPVGAVTTMCAIIEETEKSQWDDVAFAPGDILEHSQRSWMGAVARLLSDESKPRCIVVASATGASAHFVSSFRPDVPVVAVVPSAPVAGRLAVAWGITPIVMPVIKSLTELHKRILPELIARKMIKKGESYIVVANDPMNLTTPPNVIALWKY